MATKKPKGLGRGLDALLVTRPPSRRAGASPRSAVHLARLQDARRQIPAAARMDEGALGELAESIRTQGIMQPILVRELGEEPGQYEIIAGERRFRAAQLAGLKEVPVLVREVADEHAAVMALIENIQREDLNPLEEAHGVRRLLDEFGLTHEQAAQAIGRSRSATSNLLRLLNLAAPVQTMLLAGDVDIGHARALLAVDAATQIQLANQIIARRLSVREAEAGRQDRQGCRVGIGAAQEGQWRVARPDAPGGSLVRSSGHARRAQGRRQGQGADRDRLPRLGTPEFLA